MLPETSMSTWIPALHAGMTQSRGLCLNWPKAPPPVFSKEATKFTIRNIQTLRDLRDLRGEKVWSSLHNKSLYEQEIHSNVLRCAGNRWFGQAYLSSGFNGKFYQAHAGRSRIHTFSRGNPSRE